jgi:hypothetical protein
MKTWQMALVAASLTAASGAMAKGNPDKVTLGVGAKPPEGATVLFDGKSTDAWTKDWKVENGAMTAAGGDNPTKATFQDAHFHVEWKEPLMADKTGQARGNSGVFLQDRYEVQVLDSYGIADPGRGDCGAVYNVAAPLVNACKPPLEWQAYDIFFRTPRFDADGKKIEDAHVTVFQNGILVQNNTDIPHPTANPDQPETADAAPLHLQDHGNPVQYRNVWAQTLPLKGADHY